VYPEFFFNQRINPVLRDVLTLLHFTLYLINSVLLIHRPFRAASGNGAIAAVQYAVSRGPRVVVQCIAVTTNFLRAVFKEGARNFHFTAWQVMLRFYTS
jgi:hypothetical protein